MKIVHISLNSLVMDNWSYQDNLLTKYHRRLGHDVTDITSHWIMDSNNKLSLDLRSDYINPDGVRIIRLYMDGKEDYHRKFRKFKKLYETLVSLSPDLIFIHSVSFMDIKTIVKYLRENPDILCYADNHADFSNSARNWLSKNVLHKIIWRHYAQMLIPYVNKFYGVLPARVDFLVNIYGIPRSKCELLVMGADDDKVKDALSIDFRENIKSRYNIKENDFLIMTGGKIDLAKQQTLLLMEAVKKLSPYNVKLIVFGSIVDELKEKFNRMLNDNIIYIGWIDSGESNKYFAASDLVVFPGRHSVMWEQVVGLGKPMVCKYWDGTDHVDIGGNVMFLYQDSTEEIYNRLKYIIENRDIYEKMSKIASNNGMKYFSYYEIAKRSIDNS